MKPTLRTRLAEARYWYVQRPLRKLGASMIHALPVKFKRAVFVDVAALATTRPAFSGREVPTITILEAMETWKPELVTS